MYVMPDFMLCRTVMGQTRGQMMLARREERHSVEAIMLNKEPAKPQWRVWTCWYFTCTITQVAEVGGQNYWGVLHPPPPPPTIFACMAFVDFCNGFEEVSKPKEKLTIATAIMEALFQGFSAVSRNPSAEESYTGTYACRGTTLNPFAFENNSALMTQQCVAFVFLTSMGPILIPNCSLLQSNDMNSLKRIFTQKSYSYIA